MGLKRNSKCNCDASCGENRYHIKGSEGCIYKDNKIKFHWCDQCGQEKYIVYAFSGYNKEVQICQDCLEEFRV